MNEEHLMLRAAFDRALQALEGWSPDMIFGLMRIHLLEDLGVHVELSSTEDFATLSDEHALVLALYLTTKVL